MRRLGLLYGTARGFRPGGSRQNAQWSWSRPVTEISIVGYTLVTTWL
jgi:hypothetical protein